MKQIINLKPIVLFAALILLLSACAPGNVKFDAAPANFWMGLWHGFIALFTFIISLFNDNVTVYEVSNVGKLYNLGFILGIMIFFGGGSRSSCSWKR